GDILNTPAEPTFNPGRAALPAICGDITFEHVTFRYRVDGPEVLHDVSFSVPAGQIVGIVGPSGSGKSTLAKLAQRLYVPESGRVLVDGVDLAMVDSAWLRRQLGVVLQENVLFNRSVRDNIALADPAMPIEQVIAAAELAGAHEFILELPEGYDTVVGERGSSLSGGQKQRIAIARALVTNPRILIFDEATSALDYESERVIQQNMQEIAKGRTVFIIAHRLSTVRRTDRIITIDAGRVVEDGNHDNLIKTGGRYASLHRLQAGIHEVHLGEGPQFDAIVDRRGLTDLKAQVDQRVLAPIYERIKAELSPNVSEPRQQRHPHPAGGKRPRHDPRRISAGGAGNGRAAALADRASHWCDDHCAVWLGLGLGVAWRGRHHRRGAGKNHPKWAHQSHPAVRD